MWGEHEDTIAALSTPPGESGIAVVRVSGAGALPILSDVFQTTQKTTDDEWEHRRVYHGRIVDDGEAVDEVMCTVIRGPDSYTGQDIVEVSCHGGVVVVSALLELLMKKGARAAEPGEFTKRAFLAGKMDLIQAEAVADLIHARSELQRQVAQHQLEGALSERINRLAGEMLDLLGLIEANIDFIEEDIDTLDVDAAVATLAQQKAALDELLDHGAIGRPFREGYQVAIAGPVNAGKSSLFNRLLGESRAIVTEIPGTTRDVLREPIVIDGVLFMLQDTAGLRGTKDRVEAIGVDLAENAADRADVVLFVVDGSAPLAGDVEGRVAAADGERAIVVINKEDLGQAVELSGAVVVSAHTGAGLDGLRAALLDRVGRDQLSWIARERVVLNSRLARVLRAARTQLDKVEANLRTRAPLEILALDAREALQHYESATGKRYEDGLLDVIFSRFCIGK